MPRLVLAFVSVSLAWVAAARAEIESQVIAPFARPGAQPLAPLVAHPDGNFYTTTSSGGVHDAGMALRVSRSGEVTPLVSFSGLAGESPGRSPIAALALAPAGALLGTTASGGAGDFGTIFSLSTSGEFRSLHAFTGTDGGVPGALVRSADGNFHGVTEGGGANGAGTIFRLTAEGRLSTLVEFTGRDGSRRGEAPIGPLVVVGQNLYGVTRRGGANDRGTVFRLGLGGAWSTLVDFTGDTGGAAGAEPSAGLMLHSDGFLYGTTEAGGRNGFGLIFRLSLGGAYSVLHEFADTDGSQPAGVLAEGPDGFLFGTTAGGGRDGFGAIFRWSRDGAFSALAHFSGVAGATPGAVPRAGLLLGSDGAFLGTTSAGGLGNRGVLFRVDATGAYRKLADLGSTHGWTPSGAPVHDGRTWLIPLAEGGPGGGGVIARMEESGATTALASFGGTLGEQPSGSLLVTATHLLGVTAAGGSLGRGAFYRIDRGTQALSVAHHFVNGSGSVPEGPLIAGDDGQFYGVAREGGAAGRGGLFRLPTEAARPTIARLASFTGAAGAAPGMRPRGPLAKDADGSFVGVAERGGSQDAGVIFRLSSSGTYAVLHEFTSAGPRSPTAGLVRVNGSFFGTTSAGGAGDFGTVFRFANGTISILAEFTGRGGELPGDTPIGALTPSNDGSLFGLTANGGAEDAGALFRVRADGRVESLVSFTGHRGAFPGSPVSPSLEIGAIGGLTMHTDGWLYGTLPSGGAGGGGVFFRLRERTDTPLEAWKRQHLGDPSASDLADPDGDGLSTLVEYGLGRSPRFREPALPASLGPNITLMVTRDPSHNDVTVEVQASGDLRNWTSIAASVDGAPFAGPGYVGGDDASSSLKQVQVRDPNSGGRRFLRVRVTR